MSTRVYSSTYATPSSYTHSRSPSNPTLIDRRSYSYGDSTASNYYTRLNEKAAPSGTIHLHSPIVQPPPKTREYSPPPRYYSQHGAGESIGGRLPRATRPRPQTMYVEPEFRFDAGDGGRYTEKTRWVEPRDEEIMTFTRFLNKEGPPLSPAPPVGQPGQPGPSTAHPPPPPPAAAAAPPPTRTTAPRPKSYAGVGPIPGAPEPRGDAYGERKARGERTRLRDVIGGIMGRAGENLERIGDRVGGNDRRRGTVSEEKGKRWYDGFAGYQSKKR